MKRLCALFLFSLALGLAAAEPFKIRCSTYPVWLLTSEIIQGSGVAAEVVIPPGTGCPHDYVLVPRDMERLSEPDQAVVINGLGMDELIQKALRKVNREAPVIEAARETDKMVLFDAHEEPNPHLFASPDSARVMAKNIADGLSKLDEERAGLYQNNAQKLDKELAAMAEKFAALKKPDNPVPAVVIQHGIFSYLARLMGVKAILLSESDDETTLTPAQLRRLVREVRKEKACMIWADAHAPQDAVEALARECNLPVVTLDVLSGGNANVSTGHYLRTMEKNRQTLELKFR